MKRTKVLDAIVLALVYIVAVALIMASAGCDRNPVSPINGHSGPNPVGWMEGTFTTQTATVVQQGVELTVSMALSLYGYSFRDNHGGCDMSIATTADGIYGSTALSHGACTYHITGPETLTTTANMTYFWADTNAVFLEHRSYRFASEDSLVLILNPETDPPYIVLERQH